MSTSLSPQYRWHTIEETFKQIRNKETPWVAIGNFLNDWWAYAIAHRKEMVETPLPPATTPTMHRWAAFCAAMVEWLCEQDGIPCPAWTKQECYILREPWFFYRRWDSRAWLLATTPAPFKMRNIFGGDRMFLNKWTLKKTTTLSHKWTAQEMGLG